MSKAISGLFSRVLIQGSILTATIAVVGGAIGLAVAGQPGLVSALIGAALALVFATLTAVSVWLGGKLPLGGFFGLVLGGWLIKLVAFILVISALKGADFINGPVLFFTLVASILGNLTVDSLVYLKARIPVVGD